MRVKCPPGFACKEPFSYVQLSSLYVYDDNKVFSGNVISIEEVVEHTIFYRVSKGYINKLDPLKACLPWNQ